MTRPTVCHITTVHTGLDVRIFYKQCTSVAKMGYNTHLVAFGTREQEHQAIEVGVCMHRLPASRNRFDRLIFQSFRSFILARRTKADIYHFHDPELIPLGIIFRLIGCKVVYDVHEDLRKDIYSKLWIPSLLRRPLSILVDHFEYYSCKYFFNVASATPAIGSRYKNVKNVTEVIMNYPLLKERNFEKYMPFRERKNICYVGGVSVDRGVDVMVGALEKISEDVQMDLVGRFNHLHERESMIRENGWKRVVEHGYVDPPFVSEIISRCFVGVVVLKPIPNYLEAIPTKLFEYLYSGVPVICSNFPLWQSIVDEGDCGICVSPNSSEELADAISYLLENPEVARKMGEQGQKMVLERWNWSIEEKKLDNFYLEILRN